MMPCDTVTSHYRVTVNPPNRDCGSGLFYFITKFGYALLSKTPKCDFWTKKCKKRWLCVEKYVIIDMVYNNE